MENKGKNEWRWCIPKKVQDVVLKDENVTCDNPSLYLAKFVRVGGTGGNKQKELKAVCACQEKYGKAPALDLPKQVECVWGELRSRLAVNLTGGILENANICLHPHFGYPYLPGSAVKGIARHAAWCEWKKLEGEAKQDIARRIATVFGYPTGDEKLDAMLEAAKEKPDEKLDHAGCVAFLGAFPEKEATIEVDVLTCHHAKYYSDPGKHPQATDDEKPNVQPFPVVQAGVTFCFPLVPLRKCGEVEMKAAKNWLREAITVNGAGAKTAAGYGWFKNVTQEREALREKLLAAKQIRARLDTLRTAVDTLLKEAPTPETASSLQEQAKTLMDEAETLKADESIKQRLREFKAKCNNALPKESTLDTLRRSWNSEKRILKDAKEFLKANTERREAMLTLFSESNSLPAQVYAKIRNGVKGFPGDAQKAIREAMKAKQGGQA